MNRRLDSWKAIAAYLGRDAATARRWEKIGLPVHRVAGAAGRSVFAYTDEIDGWLAASKSAPVPEPIAPAADPVPPLSANRSSTIVTRSLMMVALVVLVVTASWAMFSHTAPPQRVVATDQAVVAYDGRGREEWRYEFPANTRTALPAFGETARILDAGSPRVLVSTSHRYTTSGGPVWGGELLGLDPSGHRQRVFSFDDEVAMRGTKFTAPWVITGFAPTGPPSSRQIAVSAHHFTWSPSLVTLLDYEWHRAGTFVHDGWIETLGWAGAHRLVAGGFEQEKDGGVVILLDTVTMTPIRMVVMPRSELNVVTGSRFNRASVEVVNDRLLVRTVEMPLELSQGAVDGIYEFTPALELERASFGSRYWEMHHALEVQGKLHHSQADCPDRAGPREVLVWELATGWRTQPIAAPASPL